MTSEPRAEMLDRIDRALTMLDCAEVIKTTGGAVEIDGVRITRTDRSGPTFREQSRGFLVAGAPGSGVKGHQIGDKVTAIPLTEPTPPSPTYAAGGVITEDQVRRLGTPRFDALIRELDVTANLRSQLIEQRERADRAESERDAARRRACNDLDVHWRYDDALSALDALRKQLDEAEATVGRVRAALGRHPRTCEVYTETDHPERTGIEGEWCGWKRAVADVERALLDGVPGQAPHGGGD